MTIESAKATTMRISSRNRDALLRVIAEHEDATTLDEAMRIVLFEWDGYRAMARIAADPRAMADYQSQARTLAEGNVAVDDDRYEWETDAHAQPTQQTG